MTDVDQAHAEVAFIRHQHRVRGRQRLQNQTVHLQTAALHAFVDVLRSRDRDRDHVHLGFEPHTEHAGRLANALLAVDRPFLRHHVQHFLVIGDRHGTRGIDHALLVGLADLLVAHRDDALRIEGLDVTAGNSGIHRLHAAARHQLGLLDRTPDRLRRRLDIHHHATRQAARGVRAQTHDLQRTIGADLADDRHDLGGADIQADQQILGGPFSHFLHPLLPSADASRRRIRCCSAGPRSSRVPVH